MVTLLVAAIGFSCLTPGIAIPTLGTRTLGLQAIMPLVAFYCIAFPLSQLRIHLRATEWALANVGGMLLSYLIALISERGHDELKYLVFQSLLYLGTAVGFGAILVVPKHRRIFLESYLTAALISSGVGIFQAVLSEATGFFLKLANNENFALTQQIGRAAAFTPEASVLATLLLPAFVCVWCEQNKPDSILRPLLRSRLALTLLLGGLLATRSSMLLLAPLLLLAVTLFFARDWNAFAASSARTLAVLAVAGTIFLPIYETRLKGSDAEYSGAWRALKIETGLKIFVEHPLFGTGPGYASDIASFSRYLEIPRNLNWTVVQLSAQKKGIDSTPVRFLAEGGLLGFFLAYYPVLVFWRRARAAAGTDEWRPFFSLALALLFTQTAAVGYRDIATYLLPSILFAVAHTIRLERGANLALSGRLSLPLDRSTATRRLLRR